MFFKGFMYKRLLRNYSPLQKHFFKNASRLFIFHPNTQLVKKAINIAANDPIPKNIRNVANADQYE